MRPRRRAALGRRLGNADKYVCAAFPRWPATATLVEAVLDRVLAIGLLLNFVELVAEGVSRVRPRNREAERVGRGRQA